MFRLNFLCVIALFVLIVVPYSYSQNINNRYPILTYGPTKEVARAKGIARAEKIAKQSGKKYAVQNETYSKFSGGSLWKCRLDVYFYRKNVKENFTKIKKNHDILIKSYGDTRFLNSNHYYSTQFNLLNTNIPISSDSIYVLESEFSCYREKNGQWCYIVGSLAKSLEKILLTVKVKTNIPKKNKTLRYKVTANLCNNSIKMEIYNSPADCKSSLISKLLKSKLYDSLKKYISKSLELDSLLEIADILLKNHAEFENEEIKERYQKKLALKWMTAWPGKARFLYDLGEDKLIRARVKVTAKSSNITYFSGMKTGFDPNQENVLVVFCPKLKFTGTSYYIKGVLYLTINKTPSLEIARKYYERFYHELKKNVEIVPSETIDESDKLRKKIQQIQKD